MWIQGHVSQRNLEMGSGEVVRRVQCVALEKKFPDKEE